MPYKVNYILTKPNVSVPDFYPWIRSLPDNFMESLTGPEGPFRASAGKSPKQIIDESIAQADVSMSENGLISKIVNYSDDGLTKTIEYVFQNQSNADAALALGSVSTSANYLREQYMILNNIQYQITKTEI